jgi:hypothetical protein
MSVRKLVEEFSALEDPRCGGKVEHRLIDILVIAVCAVIAGAESWEDIALYSLGNSQADGAVAKQKPPRFVQMSAQLKSSFSICRIRRLV